MSDDAPTYKSIDRFVNRPSAFGETLPAEGKMTAQRGLPVAALSRRFRCPECPADFGTNPDELGRHIVRHEPFRLVEELEEPVRCAECGRWLEGAKSAEGEADWHKRLCRGDVPLGLDNSKPPEAQAT